MSPLRLTRNDAGLRTSRISPRHNLRDKAVPIAHTLGRNLLGLASYTRSTRYMRLLRCYLMVVNKEIRQLPAKQLCQICFNNLYCSSVITNLVTKWNFIAVVLSSPYFAFWTMRQGPPHQEAAQCFDLCPQSQLYMLLLDLRKLCPETQNAQPFQDRSVSSCKQKLKLQHPKAVN